MANKTTFTGFLGIGGTQVNEQEKAALNDLEKSLGIAA
jgi:hypothetical protein